MKRNNSRPEACHNPNPKGIWGFEEEKKSISLPIVNGTLIDTADEISKSPMAIKSGFLSGFARAKIFAKEAEPRGVFENKRERRDGLAFAFEFSDGCVFVGVVVLLLGLLELCGGSVGLGFTLLLLCHRSCLLVTSFVGEI